MNKKTELTNQYLKNVSADFSVSPPIPREGMLGKSSDGTYRDINVKNNVNTASNELLVNLEGHQCPQNTTVLQLEADETYTGSAWQDTLDYGVLSISVGSDQDSAIDGLVIEWSNDGIDTYVTDEYTIYANFPKTLTFGPAQRYYRVKYTNGSGGTTTSFHLTSLLRKVYVKPSSHRITDAIVGQDDAELVKAVSTGLAPDGTFKNVLVTNAGGQKISIEELENSVSSNNNTQLNVTNFSTNGSYGLDIDPKIKHTINTIFNDYGDVVSVESKKKSLLKFGEVEIQTANTWTTIWYTGQDDEEETYVNRNLINSVSSSSVLDTGIGYSRTIEGHTVGDDVSVSSITQTVGTATVTTGAVHGYVIDQYVNIEGANEAGYNGIRKVLTVPTTTTFTYEVASATTSPATGIITTNHLNKTFIPQTVQFNGQTRVALTTPLSRVTRQYTHSQNNAQNSNGEMYVYENTTLTAGKPNDTTKIHLTTPEYSLNKSNNSQKASTSLSSSDYYIPTGYHAGLQEKTANLIVNIKLQYRPLGDGWRDTDDPIVLTSGESKPYPFNPYPGIPKNSDIRLLANASASCKVSGGVDGYLAKII